MNTATQFVCTFTVTVYGCSGNELPPPVESVKTTTVLSELGEDPNVFDERMMKIGNHLRKVQKSAFEANPKPYSIPDTLGWCITKVGGLGDIL